MIYHNTDYYLYFMAHKFPNCVVVNTTTSPKEYGQKLLNRKKGIKYERIKKEII